MLMVATDGIQTLEDINYPKPIDTGTNGTGKPLGGWERKDSDRGIFIARAGVYFPLDPSDKDVMTVRGRGVGRGVILENWRKIIERFEEWDKKPIPCSYERDDFDMQGWPIVHVANVSRFCGAKSSITRTVVEGKFQYHRASGNHLAKKPEPHYGQWITRQVAMSFNPRPKRESHSIGEDGRSLELRKLPENVMSAPYDKAVISEEARTLLLMALEANEQPDADLADYEDYDA